MKYKILGSVAHNFSQSFLSFMNYLDGGYIVDDLLVAARKANGERICVQWIPDSPPPPSMTNRVYESIAYYRSTLPDFAARNGVDVEVIREFKTEIFLQRNRQVIAEAHLVDDRGKKHVSKVIF